MIAYLIKYTLKNLEGLHSQHVDARNVDYAKKKIERKEQKEIFIEDVRIIGYY